MQYNYKTSNNNSQLWKILIIKYQLQMFNI